MQISVDRWMLTKWTHTRVKKQNRIKTPGDPPDVCRLLLPGSMSALPTLTSMNSFCLFLNFVSVEPNSMCPFVSGLFHAASCLQDSPMPLRAVEVHCGSVLLTIPLCDSSTAHLPTTEGQVGHFQGGLILKSALWTPAPVFGWTHAAISVGCPWGVELLVMGTGMFNVSRSFQWMYPLTLPPATGKCSSYSVHMLANA